MKLLISGYYGFGNMGDEAILTGLLGAIRGRYHVAVLSRDPAATSCLHGVEAVHRYFGAPSALSRCDALVSGGGGLLQDATSQRSLAYYLGLIRWARRLGKRVAVFGQSIGPLSPAGLHKVAQALRGLPVAVRDRHSLELLKGVDVKAVLTADPALLLGSGESALPISGPTLLIPRGGYPGLTDALVEVATALGEAGAPLATLALHADQDEPEIARLLSAAPRTELWQATTPLEVLARTGSAGYVVSARLHGLILAAATGRAYCGLVYDSKVASFLEETGAPAFAHPIDRDTLVRTVRDRPAVSRKRISDLRSRAWRGIDWLENLLSDPNEVP